MKVIRNLTRRPLRISLPGGKLLHLGPGQEGRIGDDAVTAALERRIAAGEIEVVGSGGAEHAAPGESGSVPSSTAGHHPPTVVRPKGNR